MKKPPSPLRFFLGLGFLTVLLLLGYAAASMNVIVAIIFGVVILALGFYTNFGNPSSK